MTLRIVKPGILTSVQGLARRGYSRFGINPGGAMDTAAVRLINLLLGNQEADAAIEMHFPAAEFEAVSDCTAALGGADFNAELNGEPVPVWRVFQIRRGDRMSFARPSVGSRAYLALAGGFDADEWLGSKSTSLAAGIGGIAGRALAAGDQIRSRLGEADGGVRRSISREIIPVYGRFPTIRVLPGPEFGLLSRDSRRAFEDLEFKISPESNRMGFRLSGEDLILEHRREMASSPVTFGTIQLLPSGQLIMLMVDHQTSGGYPRVATVIARDLPVAAQLSAGDKVGFRFIGVAEAEELIADFERDLAVFRVGCMYSVTKNFESATNRS